MKNYDILIILNELEFLTYSKIAKLCNNYDYESSFLEHLNNNKIEFLNFLSIEEFEKLVSLDYEKEIATIKNKYQKLNVSVLTIFDSNYPNKLKLVENPPFVLYYMGNLQLLNLPAIAIVGTRRTTDYGKVVTKKFTKELAENGLAIISGLASGVDAIAHESALEVSGNTIAVIAGGFEHIYPQENFNLAKKIIENNLIVTESKPSQTPQTYLFPMRNRIIAGLSDAVLVTEAGIRSGALITAKYAKQYDKPLFAVPGKITARESEGCNLLIKNDLNAFVVSADDIFERLKIDKKQISKKCSFQLDINELNVIDYIRSDKKSYQELLEHTKLAPQTLNALLMSLQVRKVIDRLPGNYYITV